MTAAAQTAPTPWVSRLAVTLARALGVLVAAILFSLGWGAGRLVHAALWMTAAVQLGYRDARAARSGSPGRLGS